MGFLSREYDQILCEVLFDPSSATVYKVLSAQRKGFEEARFYESVFSTTSTCPFLRRLKAFLPAYRGLFYQVDTHHYLVGLEDMLNGMEHPNAMDLKLGRVSYTPDATPAKVSTEKAKYPWRRKLGFFITGIRVDGVFYDRVYGKSIGPTTVYEKGVRVFLGGDDVTRRTLLARAFLDRLRQLTDWFEEQMRYRFVASSLFLCYDWSEPRSPGDLALPNDRFLRVYLIDFARWSELLDGCVPSLDFNVLYGLHRLLKLFRRAAQLETAKTTKVIDSGRNNSNLLSPSPCSLPSSPTHKTYTA
ncbi:unnamed protein product [Mesocestoides corti]|uniref:Kinase n=1 Tax=Mesocestoides corti TaxID=53468 RepID=A0A0R3U4I4_MESCO|nr:unnamed protein product [Mesocestoides corti]